MEDKLFNALFNAKVLTEAIHNGGIETVDLTSAAIDAAMQAKLQAPLVTPFVESILGHKLEGADTVHSAVEGFLN